MWTTSWTESCWRPRARRPRAAWSRSATAGGGGCRLSGGVGVETRHFFGRYARMLGRRRVAVAPTAVVGALARAISVFSRDSEVTPAAVEYLTRRGTYSIERARSLLGYEPAVGLDEGMARTEAWLRGEGLLG